MLTFVLSVAGSGTKWENNLKETTIVSYLLSTDWQPLEDRLTMIIAEVLYEL